MPSLKALRIEKPFDYALIETPAPEPGEGEALIRVRNCGICGSDVDIIEGVRPKEVTSYPLIMGHEFSGVIEVAPRGSTEFRAGDKVAVNTVVGCGRCESCLRGWVCHCLNGGKQLGTTLPGGMAEFVTARQDLLFKLPAQMDLAVAALAEPASCAAHGVSKARIEPGDSVAILGCGPIGALALQIARLHGPKQLILIEIDADKLARAPGLGATHTIDARTQDVTGEVMRLTGGRGVQAIIDCTGHMPSIKQTADYIATKGRIVVIGVPPQYDLEIGFMKLLFQDASFQPSNGYTLQIWLDTLRLLREGMIDAEQIITHRLPLERAVEGLQIVQQRSQPAVKVMLAMDGH